MKVPKSKSDLRSALDVQPIVKKTRVRITSEAIVIPDTGKLDVPIVPVKRPATMMNNIERTIERIPARKVMAMFPPEIMKPTTNVATIPIRIAKIPSESRSPASAFLRPSSVALTELMIVGIRRIAPIIPPEIIIPAPMYLTYDPEIAAKFIAWIGVDESFQT